MSAPAIRIRREHQVKYRALANDGQMHDFWEPVFADVRELPDGSLEYGWPGERKIAAPGEWRIEEMQFVRRIDTDLEGRW